MLEPVHTEVLVVGAGAAGTAAAIAAARNGAKTLLVEYNGFLGGISSTLPWIGFHDREYRQVVKGLAHEIVSELRTRGAASDYTLDIKCSSIVSVDGHMWKVLAMDLAQRSGVNLMLHTHVVDTIREGDRIAGVTVEHKTGRQEIRADLVVDASGDGDVAARAGVDWEKGRTADGLVQSPTLVFRIGGLDRDRFVEACKDRNLGYREWIVNDPVLWEKNAKRLPDMQVIILGGFAGLMEKARSDGRLHLPQTRVVGVKTHRPDELTVVTTRVLGLDPIDVTSLTDAYTRLYGQIPELLDFFRNYIPGAEAARILEIAPMLGIRESRRIMGDYVLTAQDEISGRVFEDAVAMGGYHIDIHRPGGTWVESHNVRAYTIPLRSLIARNVDSLMMAGKCISATHEAIASARVIPICMAEGQAVGTAAAMCIKEGSDIRSLDVSRLQSRLTEQGAEIGQTLGEPNWEAIDKIGQLPMGDDGTTGESDEASAEDGAWV